MSARRRRADTQGLLNNTAVLSINFDPRYPHHFIATFADGTILRFNLFAEDPVTAAVATTTMPWVTAFEPELATGAEDKMLVWKNEEFGNLGDIKKGSKEERPTWAGRNPMAAYKIGKKSFNGELFIVVIAEASCRIFARCIVPRAC